MTDVKMVREEGVEPSRCKPHAPQACASAIPPLAQWQKNIRFGHGLRKSEKYSFVGRRLIKLRPQSTPFVIRALRSSDRGHNPSALFPSVTRWLCFWTMNVSGLRESKAVFGKGIPSSVVLPLRCSSWPRQTLGLGAKVGSAGLNHRQDAVLHPPSPLPQSLAVIAPSVHER